MKIHSDCVPCLIKRIIFETELSTKNKNKQTEIIRNVCKMLSEIYDPKTCSAIIATKIHGMVYQTLGDKDPYKVLKARSNKIAKKLVPDVERKVEESKDPLVSSIICSIAGNMMDFGISGGSSKPDDLLEVFERIYEKGLGFDDTKILKKYLKNSKNVMLFTDNCGEIVFDKILCREIKRFNPNLHITLVVKGEPVLSDATMQDVVNLNFNEVVDEVLTTGVFAVGVDFDNLSKILERRLKSCDLILCKGMANYEAFSETKYHPICYLMRSKCRPIADSMNVPVNASVVKFYK